LLQDIKNTIKHSAIYGISRFASKSLSFILIPLYTSIFSTEKIADINLLESFWQYLFTICLFSFETAIVAFCAPEKDENKVKQTLFIFACILLFNSLFFIFIGYFFSDTISIKLFQDHSLTSAVFYCFLISAFESLLVIPLTIARLQSKVMLYSIISILNLAINLLLQLYFILIIGGSFEYIFLAKFIAPAVLLFLLIPLVLKNLRLFYSKAVILQIMRFSFPLMLASLLAILLNTVDRYLLVDFVSKSEIGIYTLGYSIGSIANFFIVSPFVLAFNIISWRKMQDSNASRFFTKTATYLFFTMILFSLCISLFIPELIRIFVRNEQLWESINIIRIVLFSNCLSSLYYISIQSYYFKKRTDLVFWIFSICLMFNVVGNIFLIKYFGIYASAILSVFSYLLLLLISYNLAKKVYFIKFENKKLILLSFLYILFTVSIIYLKFDSVYIETSVKFVFLGAFPLLLYFFNFYEDIELKKIRGFVLKYLHI
jgi:O-antigen/teichoic acid export membrane protein